MKNDMEALHLTIEGMTCERCVRTVEGRLRRTPGVQVERVKVGAAELHYDPAKTNVDEIADAIADEGYVASPQFWKSPPSGWYQPCIDDRARGACSHRLRAPE